VVTDSSLSLHDGMLYEIWSRRWTEVESRKGDIVAGVMRRAPALFLLVSFGLCLAIGPNASACESCCPAPSKVASFSSASCCGEECGQRLASGQDRPCVTSARTVAKCYGLPALAQRPAAALHATLDTPHAFLLWLPSSARSGTSPLRL
jgi:hypothetical protein